MQGISDIDTCVKTTTFCLVIFHQMACIRLDEKFCACENYACNFNVSNQRSRNMLDKSICILYDQNRN